MSINVYMTLEYDTNDDYTGQISNDTGVGFGWFKFMFLNNIIITIIIIIIIIISFYLLNSSLIVVSLFQASSPWLLDHINKGFWAATKT